MGLTARVPEGNTDFEPIEAGVQQAICVRYYDLGTQHFEWEGREKSARRVRLMWEVPDSRIEIEGKDLPRAISKEYTLSLHKKANLRIDLESWRSRIFTEEELEGFDLDNILGVNCMLNVIHKTNDRGTFANIASVMPLMKNMEKLTPENPLVSFNFDNPDFRIPDNTPQWIEDKIKESDEWAAYINGEKPTPSAQDSQKVSPVNDLPEEKPWSTKKEFMEEIKSFVKKLGTDVYDKIITEHRADLLNKLTKEQGLALWKSLREAETQNDAVWDEEENIPEDDIPF